MSGVRILVYSANAGRKMAMYWVSPKNPQTLVEVVGCGQFVMRSVFLGSGNMPVPEMMCPRKDSSVVNKLDLSGLQ